MARKHANSTNSSHQNSPDESQTSAHAPSPAANSDITNSDKANSDKASSQVASSDKANLGLSNQDLIKGSHAEGSCAHNSTNLASSNRTSSVLAGALRVLLIAPDAPGLALAHRLEGKVARVTRISPLSDSAALLEAIKSRRHDIALVHADAGAEGGFEIIRALCRVVDAPPSVMIADRPSLELALSVMRSGASDLLAMATPARELAERLANAARHWRIQCVTRRRLERRCARLTAAANDADATRAVLDRSLAVLGVRSGAHESTADRVNRLTLATELSATFRQELELESLLRTLLECMLKKTGPTNAAVFLPSSAGDFTLGAYANYDCPRDGAEVMLDTFAGVVAPAFERRPGIHHLPTPKHVEALLGEHAHWLPNASMVVTPCRSDDECLAVLAIFRDARDPFTPETIAKVGLVAELFSHQLSRVVRTHHRHLPKHTWASPGDVNTGDDEGNDKLEDKFNDRDDDIDLAA